MEASQRIWEVVGGVAKGGILVRRDAELDSPSESERLATGALVAELELRDDGRLHYSLLTGSGPAEGWVSIALKEKVLLIRQEETSSAAAVAAPVKLSKSEQTGSREPSYTISGVSLAVSGTAQSPLIPEMPVVRGVVAGEESQAELASIRFLMQKARMRQDVFLLGAPGPLLRHVVLRFCQLFHREVEYVGITRDTNESDLKQRREICDGHVRYVDQPPVRAALNGRILVLEGMEKAERNVLPLLNNLLENREMALEDRRFLLSPERAKQLQEENDGADWTDKLVPVHPDFLVVALGLPGRGNPLDPPLRSRFAAFAVPLTSPSNLLQALQASAPSVLLSSTQKICMVVGTLQRMASGEGARQSLEEESLRLPMFPDGGVNGIIRLLESFPGLGLGAALKRAYPVKLMKLIARQLQAIEKVTADLHIDPGAQYSLVTVRPDGGSAAILKFAGSAASGQISDSEVRAPSGNWVAPVEVGAEESPGAAAHDDQIARLQRSSIKELKAWLTEHGIPHADCFEKSEMLRKAESHLAAAPPGPPKPRGALAKPISGLILTPSQAEWVSDMLADHVAGVDMCLVGDKGTGKSVLLRSFAGLLGYRCRTVFCYKDMISRDLLQRRTTDPNGNTKWHDSPLIEAALCGDIAVLDGVERLAQGTLYSTLGPLLIDREAVLPDGSRLVAPSRWQSLLARHGEAELTAMGLRCVHPCFRCIACGEPPGTGGKSGAAWIDDEVLTLFHFHSISALPREEQLLLFDKSGSSSANLINGFLQYGERIREAAVHDLSLEPLRLSLRSLMRIGKHLQHRPGDVDGALSRCFSACLRFLPPASQEQADRLINESMKSAGISVRSLQREKDQPDRLDDLRQRAEIAASQTLQGGAQVADGLLTIRDVSCPVRVPQRLELVPDVSFVEIPKHLEVLRDMLLDWSLDHHLLLIGNQGVGKNKLADRLLGLLQCEREYVQLHRDTTVQSLTLAPSLEGGVVVWQDTPLVRAVQSGRCLVVDEADKAPLEVVCVLKSLVEDGELALLDGRTIVRPDDERLVAVKGTLQANEFVPMASGFRMVVLANRPGFPFLGNDFYRVCGDVFSCHTVDNPDIESEVALLRSVGPDVPQERIVQLSLLFTELRELVEVGKLTYPYSTRELAKLVAHLQRFPEDEIEQVAADVFSFDLVDRQRREPLLDILRRHGMARTSSGEEMLLGTMRGQRGLQLQAH